MIGVLKRGIIFCGLALLITCIKFYVVFAHENNINFKRVNIENGLSQSEVNKVFQDSEGYMWFGTSDGLNKYNGMEFQVYKYRENSFNSLSNSSIRVIKEDNEKNLWVGTEKGLNKINLLTNEIKTYLSKKNGCKLSNDEINDIFIGEGGEILVATSNGLNIYDKENNNFTRVHYSWDSRYVLNSQQVRVIEEDKLGNYWVGTELGLNKIDKKTRKIVHYDVNEAMSESKGNIVTSLYVDDKNILWIGTLWNGVYTLDINSDEIKKFNPNNSTETLQLGASIRAISKDSYNTLWIATDKGLVQYKENENYLYVYKNKPYDFDTISSDSILSIHEDSSGHIWVGTDSGVNMFNPDSVYKYYNHDIFDENSISDNYITGIYEDDEGLLWIGTLKNGLNIVDRESNKITRVSDEAGDLRVSNKLIREITGIGDEIWIATQGGLNKFNKLTGEMSIYSTEQGLPDTDLRALHIDKDGLLWIGGRNKLMTFDRKGEFVDYTQLLKQCGVRLGRVNDIHEDKDGEIWIALAGEDELVKFNKNDNLFRIYGGFSDGYKNKGEDIIFGVKSDEDGNIWLTTNYGIIKLDKKTGNHIRYTEFDGLSNNFTMGILFDSKDNLWISTNYGLSKFNPKKDEFVNFDVTDGLQGNEFNQYAYFKNKNGEMFFGGVDGLTVFNPEEVKISKYSADIKIEDIISNGERVDITDNINLSYNSNNIQLSFFVPDYKDSKRISYAYKLTGIDDNWVLSENRNYVSYTNLNPGKYTFSATARSYKGDWCTPITINIKVSNPFWKTPIAYIMYTIVLILITWIIYNRVSLLNKLVEQRTLELNNKLDENEELYAKLLQHERNKNNYFVNLSHELRTPLNIIVSVQALIKDLTRTQQHLDKDKINYYMDSVKSNSNRLLNLINNIINTSKIESGDYKLNFQENDIVYLVEEVSLSMKELVEGKGITFTIDPEMEEKTIECDKEEIEKAIVNLIANATKFTPEGGNIDVFVYDFKDKVKISVKDTGIGIDHKYHEAIFDRFNQAYEDITEEYGGSGLGLTLTRQLIELHGGEIWVESAVGRGSEFIIILPVKIAKI